MNLSVETWISIIVGVIPFGGIVTWFWKRYFGKKNRALAIEHIESKQYFHKKTDRIELKVVYNNEITCDALVLLRVAIKNTGKEDIANRALIDPIRITFSEKYKILEANTVKVYEKIKPDVKCKSNSIELSWALLKHQDQFEIEIIAQDNSSGKVRELSIDFYNSISCDINIEGVDEIAFDKQETITEKVIKRSRDRVIFIAIYAVLLTMCAILTNYDADFDYQLILQRDSTSVESLVSIFSKEDMVKIEAFEEIIPIQEFNNTYAITAIPTDLPNRQQMSLIIYSSAAILCYLGAVLLLIMHYLNKKKLLNEGTIGK